MSFKVASNSSPVFSGYIKALYLLIGFTMLFDSIGRVLMDYRGTIAMLVMTFITSLSGLIMSCLAKARGTRNKSKITAVFSCVIAAMIFQTAGIVLANKFASYFGPGNVVPGPGHAVPGHAVLAIASIACQALCLILVLTTGIIIITMTTRRDNLECPRLSMPAKLLVGIPVIISSLFTVGVLIIFTATSSASRDVILALHKTQIACAVLIGNGILLGIILGLFNRQRRRHQPQDDTYQCVVVA